MRKLFWEGLILLPACQTSKSATIERTTESIANAAPRTVLAQSIRKDLGNGFYDVSKSVVNSSDHWEGIGHFGYVYYRNSEICQCSPYSTVISPEGKYFVYYSNRRDRLELFDTKTKETSVLQEGYKGYPKSADWILDEKTAVVILSNPVGKDTESLSITLDKK